ncbi:MAG: thiamine pyrophosphate-binding protein [Nitrososphaerales archaeon]
MISSKVETRTSKPDQEKKEIETEQKYSSDFIVDILRKYDIEYVASNIGSTFRGLWESLVNYGGDISPKCISVCHEEIAVALAHGYAKATEKPMVALVHDLVGPMHATMAVYNAWVDRIPVIILGASGPVSTPKKRPWIDWVHSASTPNELLRNYVKWDDFPMDIQSVPTSFARAYNIAVTNPKAPVFICFEFDSLEQTLAPSETPTLPSRQTHAPPLPIGADREALEGVAKILTSSENPVIVAGRVGRARSAVKSLVELAEVTGSSVYDSLEAFNFPNTHALDYADKGIFERADLILALEAPNLEYVLTSVDMHTRKHKYLTRKDTRIIKIGLDDLVAKSWASDYQGLVPAELSILADTSVAIPRLTELCKRIIDNSPSLKKSISDRIERARSDHEKLAQRWVREAKAQWNDVPISWPRLAAESWEVVKDKPWVVAYGWVFRDWIRRLWKWEEPGCYLGTSGAGGLGYGLPASIGASLGLMKQNKLVIDFQPDGDLLYTTSSLWTAAHYKVPLLVVMLNNKSYYNDANHNKVIAEIRGRNPDAALHNGGDIDDPPVDFARLAQSMGLHGMGPVEKPEELKSALERAVQTVESKRETVLVDVVTKPR